MRWKASALQHLLRTLLAGFVAFIFYYHFQSSQKYWIIFSSFLLVQIRLGKTFWQQLLWLLLFGLIASCSAAITGLIGTNYYLLALYLSAVSFVCIGFGLKFSEYFLPMYMLNLFSLMSGGMIVTANQVGQRFCFVLIGLGIVIFLNAIFWPRSRQRSFLAATSECLDAIKNLQKTFFEIYLKRDYRDKHYFYETKIHQQTYQILKLFNQAQILAKKKNEKEDIEKLMRIYEAVLAQGFLRYRIKDVATFEIIDRELQALAKDETNFAEKISALEDVYHNTLQVVAAEPLAFLCFIKALKDYSVILSEAKDLHEKPEQSHGVPSCKKHTQDDGFSKHTQDDRFSSTTIKYPFHIAITVLITVFVGHYYSFAEKFWLPMSALLVMQTPTGAYLHHGLRRYFVMVTSVVIGTLTVLWVQSEIIIDILLAIIFSLGCYISIIRVNCFPRLPLAFLAVLVFMIAILEPTQASYKMPLIYARAADMTLGAAIGLLANLLIFPAKPDVEFRKSVITILHVYSDYLAAIAQLMLGESYSAAEEKRKAVEKILQTQFPEWVYEYGFNIELRQGHRHFLVLVERLGQILFSMHQAARYDYDKKTRQLLSGSLTECVKKATKMMNAMITVLELKKLTEGIDDFEQDIIQLEQTFQTAVAPSIELLDLSDDYMSLAAFIYDLKDLRISLLKLLEALS